MKKVFTWLLIALLVLFVLLLTLFCSGLLSANDVYVKCFRHYIFTSFLGIGSFIFALTTAVLFSMEQKIYENPEYKQDHADSNHANGTSTKLYAPLTNVGRLFLFTVQCCIGTSIVQITIGLYESAISAALGMSTALVTLGLILYVVHNVKDTMYTWFNILDGKD